jgi:hypothetical protein
LWLTRIQPQIQFRLADYAITMVNLQFKKKIISQKDLNIMRLIIFVFKQESSEKTDQLQISIVSLVDFNIPNILQKLITYPIPKRKEKKGGLWVEEQ